MREYFAHTRHHRPLILRGESPKPEVKSSPANTVGPNSMVVSAGSSPGIASGCSEIEVVNVAVAQLPSK